MLTVYTILDTLNLVLFAVGAAICFRAFRAKRNTGYLILVAYFVLSFAFFGFGRILYTSHESEKPRQAQVNPPAQGVAVPVRKVELPIMPLFLVGGLWLIGKDTDAKKIESITNESN